MRSCQRARYLSKLLLCFAFVANQATSQSTVFSEGSFSGWTSTIVQVSAFPSSPPSGTSSGTIEVVSGGNPGDAIRATNFVVSNAGIFHFILPSSPQWIPATQGTIVSVSMTLESRAIVSPFCCAGQGVFIACEQNGTVYVSNVNTIAGVGTTWHVVPTLSEVENGFTNIQNATVPGPDFSTFGGPLRFGFCVTNGTCFNCGGFSTVLEYDNWSITISPFGYEGSGGDLRLRSSNSSSIMPDGVAVKFASIGSIFTLQVDSPAGSLIGQPLFLAANIVTSGSVPALGPPLWLDPATVVVLVDGFGSSSGSLPVVVGPFSNIYSYSTPPGVNGLSAFFQSATIGSGGFWLSPAMEIRFL